MMKRVELLSPAGDMERLELAVKFGADAVYVGGTQFGMRSNHPILTRRSCKRLASWYTLPGKSCI